ncbi:MAG: 50S ribosomal protein L25, partial [Pseudazoarcus pumilus]|nr:50S ribosomal protein L25 [Pseudazoarcus pumilus]
MNIEFKATKRVDQGTGASRRLRRAGQLPGIIYGAHKDAEAITLDHNELYHLLRKEAFHSS